MENSERDHFLAIALLRTGFLPAATSGATVTGECSLCPLEVFRAGAEQLTQQAFDLAYLSTRVHDNSLGQRIHWFNHCGGIPDYR